MKVGDLIEWGMHSVCPKAIVIGFDGDFAKLFWLPNPRFSNGGRVSLVEKQELEVISESR